MNVQGSNQQVVRITVGVGEPGELRERQHNPFTPIAPATDNADQFGIAGTDFNIGGSIAIPSTADGSYTGNFGVHCRLSVASV